MHESLAKAPPQEAAGFLERTRARKVEELKLRRQQVSSEALLRQAVPTTRSLRSALHAPGARFILEHKRRAPSRGTLDGSAQVGSVLRAYHGAADAVSVLADAAFLGSLDDITEARRHTDKPVLCKDFVLGTDQVVEARVAGADAALVILALVDDATAADCMKMAARLGMDVLVETHNADELDRALALGANLIGINNRDLTTLQVDLTVTERLAQRVPQDVVLVTESGVADAADVARLAPMVDAFLIGSAVMQAQDRFDAARTLTLGRVKVCGLTRPQDALLAASLGARFGGLVFARSPRQVTLAMAHEVAGAVPHLPWVAVFRDQDPGEMVPVLQALPFAAVQLHGSSCGHVDAVRAVLEPGAEVWCAAGVGKDGVEQRAAPRVDRLVYDTRHEGQTGGTGAVFDWSQIPAHALATSLLAGGLSAANAQAARATGAWGLDVSSRLESSPGHKAPALLRAFFDAVRPVCRTTREMPHAD